ncbi:MAG: flagellar export chaperone FliS [Candidatus Muirbacterium halophilum]|nr:flagellar export chaperone FliS [Candidatus Muirbacterium halophilum]MCK9474758.1 flagellar export chaperone FliS [Candidatus Muirbacterium halophilum]
MLNLGKNAENYRRNQITTASEGQLIIMLYDGALRFLSRAKSAVEEKNIEESHIFITKTRKIVLELMFSLDMDKGGSIAKNLYELYFFINQELIKANIKKDTNILDNCHIILKELRETWKQVVEKNKMEKIEAEKK